MSLKSYVGAAFGFLPRDKRRRFIAVIVVLAAMSVLDLIALLLVVAITSMAGAKTDSEALGQIPDWLRHALASAGMKTASSVLAGLGLTVVLLFVGKAVLASAVLRRVLQFLAAQEAELTNKLMVKVMRAPLTFHLQRRNLDLMTDITVGAESLIMKAIAPTMLIAAEVVLMTMLAVGLLILAPVVAIGSVLYFAVVLAVLSRYIGRRMAIAGAVDEQSRRSAIVVTLSALAGYREIVTRGVSGYFISELRTVHERGAVGRAQVAHLALIPRYFLESALVVGMAFAFGIQVPFTGAEGALKGLALFAVAGFRLLPSIQRLQGSSTTIKSGQPFGERTLALMKDLDEALTGTRPDPDPATAVPLQTLRQGITLDQVSFAYPRSTALALDHVSVTFKARKMTALVGASGSGKSTLIDILLGLLPPTTGAVLVDGVGLELARTDWLKLVGYVPQDIFLMPSSIRENVAFGITPAAVDDTDVWDALRRARLDDVVREIPGGLDYRLGDGGSGVSGGQRQRLGIARALYHRPEVLILDEATSALDVETEAEITRTFTELEGLTKIVVAHRLSTVRHADEVLFFRAGRLEASGRFDDVSRAIPDFARQVQLSGLTPAEAER
jgi:ABC-type multidrug transport system fused ATPase/permease subunit